MPLFRPALLPPSLLACALLACAPDAPPVTGVVLAAGHPVAGARVRLQTTPDLDGRPGHVTTDAAGRFTLPLPPTDGAPPPGAVGSIDDPRALRWRITAGLDGWKNGDALAQSGDDVTITLAPLPPPWDGRPTTFRFSSAAVGGFPCLQCHGAMGIEWQASSHARAVLDPLVLDEQGRFLAFFDAGGDRGRRFTEGGATFVVMDDRTGRGECVLCHAPALSLDATAEDDLRVYAADMDAPRAVREGVTCDVCHKMRAPRPDLATAPDGPTRPGLALAEVRLPGPGDPEVLFGPFDDTIFAPTGAAFAPALSTGDGCAPCHSNARVLTLSREMDNGTGTDDSMITRRIFGEDTWREWRFDPATVRAVETDGDGAPPAWGDGPFVTARNYAGRPLACQDCHMRAPPPDPDTGEQLDGARPVTDWQRVATHSDAPLRHPATLSPHGFEGATARMLAWATELRVRAARSGDGTAIDVDVELENRHTGHRVPTGLPDRNVLLVVTARDEAGRPLPQHDGPTLPAWAGLTGAGRAFARRLADARGVEGVFYAYAVREAAPDNRLRPGETDRSRYRFAAPGAPGTPGPGMVEIEVRVVERRRFPADLAASGQPIEDIPGDRTVVRVQ